MIRLNRDANGFDALPSESNDAAGAYFTAPCGCIDLVVDGGVVASKFYFSHVSSVTFADSVRMGNQPHSYQAVFWPNYDVASCGVAATVCPPVSGQHFYSGTLSVEAATTGNKTYPNRCERCPAWCDPSHPLYAEKKQTQAQKCSKGKRDITIDVPFQSQLEASCNPNYLCGYAAANMLTARLHNVSPTVEYMQKMALEAKGSTCPITLSSPEEIVKAARKVGDAPKSDYYLMNFEEIKNVVATGEPLKISVIYEVLAEYRCSTGKNWKGGHTLTVIGFSEPSGYWRVHDPLCPNAKEGANRRIPSDKFRAAALASVEYDGKASVVLIRK